MRLRTLHGNSYGMQSGGYRQAIGNSYGMQRGGYRQAIATTCNDIGGTRHNKRQRRKPPRARKHTTCKEHAHGRIPQNAL